MKTNHREQWPVVNLIHKQAECMYPIKACGSFANPIYKAANRHTLSCSDVNRHLPINRSKQVKTTPNRIWLINLPLSSRSTPHTYQFDPYIPAQAMYSYTLCYISYINNFCPQSGPEGSHAPLRKALFTHEIRHQIACFSSKLVRPLDVFWLFPQPENKKRKRIRERAYAMYQGYSTALWGIAGRVWSQTDKCSNLFPIKQWVEENNPLSLNNYHGSIFTITTHWLENNYYSKLYSHIKQ